MPVSTIHSLDTRAAQISDKHQRFIYDEFKVPIICMDGPGDTTVPETTGPNVFQSGPNIFEYQGIGTLDAATILWNADTGLDLTDIMTSDNVGVTIQPAVAAGKASTTGLRTKGTFTIGTDSPFYFSLKFKITDVSGTDFCAVGFRKSEATQTTAATLETYTDIAVLDVISGDIKIKTILNDGTTTTTDTTQDWTDGQTKTLCVIVDSDGSLSGTAGSVYYTIDGAVPTVLPTALFSFDSGDTVNPFFLVQNDTDIANGTILLKWESGFIGVGDGIAVNVTSHTTA